MHQLNPSPDLLKSLQGQTAIVTGAARGIGAAAATIFNSHGANVVIADLPGLQSSAEALIATFRYADRAIFLATDITQWKQMVSLFEDTISRFGKVDMVVANAGVLESTPILDMQCDEEGTPLESQEALKVIDVNLKGTLNTLRLGLHYLSKNPLSSAGGSRGSITLVSSTSGYFGSTGNAAYVASKHGIVGLLRASQKKATELNIRVNSIAPCYTPTYITSGFGDDIVKAGVEANTPEMVGSAIAYAAVDETRCGTSCLVAGKYLRELEHTQKSLFGEWLGGELWTVLDEHRRLSLSCRGLFLMKQPTQGLGRDIVI